MRDLRSNIRTFTEPIKVEIQKRDKVEGILTTITEFSKDVWGNVWIDKKQHKNDVGSDANGNTVTVEMLSVGVDIIPENTHLTIRDKKYVVKTVDKFGINTETIRLTAVRTY